MQFKNYQLITGTRVAITATVHVIKNGEEVTRSACGEGSIEALFNAVDLISSVKPELLIYHVESTNGSGSGKKAKAQTTVILSCKGCCVKGYGESSDTLKSGVLAYIGATNDLLKKTKS